MKQKSGQEIFYTDINVMITSIKQFTQDNCAYVEIHDDLKRLYYGWFCPKTNTYFYMQASHFRNQRKGLALPFDSYLKRKIASIPLSNCKNDKEYNSLKEKLNKLKAFW